VSQTVTRSGWEVRANRQPSSRLQRLHQPHDRVNLKSHTESQYVHDISSTDTIPFMISFVSISQRVEISCIAGVSLQ
jgi:hypothetical protein